MLALIIAAASLGQALVVSEFSIAGDRERVERQRRGGGRGFGIRPAIAEDFDGLYQFCRVAFRGNRAGDGGGWGVDYPRADINMSIRLSELTKTHVSFFGSRNTQPRRCPPHRRNTVSMPDGDDDGSGRSLSGQR
jgi:hypothetical protein